MPLGRHENVMSPNAGTCRTCYGVAIWDSEMMRKKQSPRCVGLLVRAGEKDANSFSPHTFDATTLVNFRYMCVGKSLYHAQTKLQRDGEPINVTRTERDAAAMPDCRFLQVTSAAQGSIQPHAAGAPARAAQDTGTGAYNRIFQCEATARRHGHAITRKQSCCSIRRDRNVPVCSRILAPVRAIRGAGGVALDHGPFGVRGEDRKQVVADPEEVRWGTRVCRKRASFASIPDAASVLMKTAPLSFLESRFCSRL